MTTNERVERMYEHREADRAPVIDFPWNSTVERWRREGMPEGVSFVDYFDLDRFVSMRVDGSPRYPVKVLEETDEYTVVSSERGATQKKWKHAGGVPEFLDFTIKDPDSWAEAKARMQPAKDRIDWESLRRNYRKWREEGAWITARFWFGFDVTHSWVVGTERLLMAMVTDPEWVVDMFNQFLDDTDPALPEPHSNRIMSALWSSEQTGVFWNSKEKREEKNRRCRRTVCSHR